MSQTIQMEEFLAALAAAETKSDDPTRGMTARELEDALGLGPSTIKRRLYALHKAGQLIVSIRHVVGLTGNTYPTPCYRVKSGGNSEVLRNGNRGSSMQKGVGSSRKPRRRRK